MTCSIIALEPSSGQLGVVVATAIPGGAALVPHVQAGAGAIASQGSSGMSLGAGGLALLQRGLDAPAVVDA